MCTTCNSIYNKTDSFACSYNNRYSFQFTQLFVFCFVFVLCLCGTNHVIRGEWNDGFNYFEDPTPVGSTVTAITLIILGSYNCDSFSDQAKVSQFNVFALQ